MTSLLTSLRFWTVIQVALAFTSSAALAALSASSTALRLSPSFLTRPTILLSSAAEKNDGRILISELSVNLAPVTYQVFLLASLLSWRSF